jgi:hypothetical protein
MELNFDVLHIKLTSPLHLSFDCETSMVLIRMLNRWKKNSTEIIHVTIVHKNSI